MTRDMLRGKTRQCLFHICGMLWRLSQAWLRSRGMENGALFTAEDAAAAYGVTRTSYEAAAIPGASEPVPVVSALAHPGTYTHTHTQQQPAVCWPTGSEEGRAARAVQHCQCREILG